MKKAAKEQEKNMTTVPGFKTEIISWDCGHYSTPLFYEQGLMEVLQETDCRCYDKDHSKDQKEAATPQTTGQ